MPRINLLPWRDEERKERKLKFLVALGGAAVGACLTAFVGYLMMDSMVSAQEARNAAAQEQIAELDKQIEKINSLEADKARFIARMEVIEKLQRSRPEIVHIFDEIAKQLPDGVYLTAISQTGTTPEIRRCRPVVDARFRVHAQHRWLELPQESGTRHRRDQEKQRAGRDVHSVRRAGRGGRCKPSLKRPSPRSGVTRGGSGPMSILDDIKSLDPNDPGRWPLPVRVGSRGAVLRGPRARFSSTSSSGAIRSRSSIASSAKNRRCASTFKTKHSKAVNLEVYQQQLADIERSFGALLRQLPGKTEVAEPARGHLAGGCWRRSRREALPACRSEVKKDFYAELPIKIKLTGSYHQMGEFVSGIAALPRIVTLHEITIKPENKDMYDNLSFELTAKTFRYLDDAEVAAAEKAKAAAPSRPARNEQRKHR